MITVMRSLTQYISEDRIRSVKGTVSSTRSKPIHVTINPNNKLWMYDDEDVYSVVDDIIDNTHYHEVINVLDNSERFIGTVELHRRGGILRNVLCNCEGEVISDGNFTSVTFDKKYLTFAISTLLSDVIQSYYKMNK